jgi:hypothetical protein
VLRPPRTLVVIPLKNANLATAIRLSRDSLLIWPLVGVLNLTGYLLAKSWIAVPDLTAARMIGPFLTWAALAPLLAAAAAAWRPGQTGAAKIAAGHAALFVVVAFVQSWLWPILDLSDLVHQPKILARDLILAVSSYSAVVLLAWTQLLLDDIRQATAYEHRAQRAAVAASVARLTLPTRYFATLLAGIRDDLRRDAKRAESSTVTAATLLRKQLDATRHGPWALHDELELLDGYLDLERGRGTHRRLVVHATPAAHEARVWPGALAVEVCALLSHDPHSRSAVAELEVGITGTDGAVSAALQLSGARHVLQPGGPPLPEPPPPPQLAALAAFITRRGKLVAGGVTILFGVLSSAALLLMSRNPLTPAAVLAATLRVAARIALVLPVVQRLQTRRVQSLRFLAIVFGGALAGDWWFLVARGISGGNAWPLVFFVSSGAAISSVAVIFLSTAGAAATLYMIRVSSVAVERNAHALETAERLRESQARFLLWQTNPHFLFNALNSMAALMRSDRAAAERFLRLLMSFYDEMTGLPADSHPLEDELRLLSRYFDIERVRFGGAITFTVDAPPSLRNVEVPTLLLQPLVENATKHGAAGAGGTLDVTVVVRESAKRLRIEIVNPASDAGAHAIEGTGLRLTRERLAASFDGAASLAVASGDGVYTASIELPLTRRVGAPPAIRVAGGILQETESGAHPPPIAHS